ncbi:hypothetical protein FACS1894167_14020 [Synergistales bacterium]|nr:hypothetical protein FACS1894167_14020 [Synergistales bacterium]
MEELKNLLIETFGAPWEGGPSPEPRGEWFGAVINLLSDTDVSWSCDNIKKVLKNFQKDNNLKASVFYHAIRFAVTGREHGAPIALIMSCFGREETISRLKKR